MIGDDAGYPTIDFLSTTTAPEPKYLTYNSAVSTASNFTIGSDAGYPGSAGTTAFISTTEAK